MTRCNTGLKYLLFLFLAGAGFSAGAQITISEFISSATQDPDLASLDAQLLYLDAKPYKLSPLQKLEFRTRSNQLDPDRQDYAVRINPSNPWEVRSNNNFFHEFENTLRLERDIIFKKELEQRYLLIVQWLHYQELKALEEESLRLMEQQAAILEKQQGSDFFDAGDFVKLKLDQVEKAVDLEELLLDTDETLGRIRRECPAAGQPVAWHEEPGLISVDRIKMITDSLAVMDYSSSAVTFREKKIDLAEKEYVLEKSNINLGFIQTQYESYRLEQDRKPWNISLGITIPVVNPNKGDMTKQKLKMIEAEHDLEEEKQEVRMNKAVAVERLNSLIGHYEEITAKVEGFTNSSLTGTLSTMKDNNPIALVRFNANVLRLKAIQAKLKYNILVAYIEFLGYNDRLQQQPLVNYLSTTLQLVSP